MKKLSHNTVIELAGGKKLEITSDEKGFVKSARSGKTKLKLMKAKKVDFTFNGEPVKYISPGAVIVTRTNPYCYWKRQPDGTFVWTCIGK